jgi:hypothetical protein
MRARYVSLRVRIVFNSFCFYSIDISHFYSIDISHEITSKTYHLLEGMF